MKDITRRTRFRRDRGLFSSYSLLLPLAGAIVLFGGHAPVQADDSGLDVILRSGTVIDGSGAPRYVADVGVDDGYITHVGDLSDVSAETEIDATGLVVAPGFIDVHSHGNIYNDDALRQAVSSLTQGVTTEILQPDGGGLTDIPAKLALEKDGLGVNIGAYIGFNSVWREVMDHEDREPTADEVDRMQKLVVQGLADGAWGVSAGLQYTPGYYASTDEVISVVRAAQRWRTNFPNHIRNEANTVVEATKETIKIGEQTGLVPVITHMKAAGPKNWGKSEQTVGLIQDANARGTYTAADVYPWLASGTSFYPRVPAWAKVGGWDAMLERFKDPELRERIAREIEADALQYVADFDGAYVPSKRQTLAEIATEMGVEPGEAVIRSLETDGIVGVFMFEMNEEDLKRIMQNSTTAISSDGGATLSPLAHPRHYGSQPRALGHYTRDLGYLSLEDAVRKMTALPATMIGMVDRGYLAPGMAADITVFDPDTVIDRATFDNPKQFSEGIEHVLVGGELALHEGKLTGVQAGKALRRAGSMISRPMTGSDPVRASANGCVGPLDTDQAGQCTAQVAFNAASDGGSASGAFVVNHNGRKMTFRATQLGRLQVADGWATITGRGKVEGEDEERSFLVILDREDTLEDERTITIRIQNADTLKGVLSTGDSRVDTGKS